ncbi:hypothetical protein BCAR13_100062 [Paraburkholderia caribensis]|nr:hypothetical protein BCAR13_100062 [Paraburkholderia caribensis]
MGPDCKFARVGNTAPWTSVLHGVRSNKHLSWFSKDSVPH